MNRPIKDHSYISRIYNWTICEIFVHLRLITVIFVLGTTWENYRSAANYHCFTTRHTSSYGTSSYSCREDQQLYHGSNYVSIVEVHIYSLISFQECSTSYDMYTNILWITKWNVSGELRRWCYFFYNSIIGIYDVWEKGTESKAS